MSKTKVQIETTTRNRERADTPVGADFDDGLVDTLAKLIPLWPVQREPWSAPARDALLKKIRGALIRERARGLSGHWAYDLARHTQLLRVFARLEELRRGSDTANPSCVASAVGARGHAPAGRGRRNEKGPAEIIARPIN